MLREPDFRKNGTILWDFRNAEVDVVPSEDEICDFAAMIEANQDRRGKAYKMAMVADKGLYYGLIRMYQAYSGPLPLEHMVFCSLPEALRWINETCNGEANAGDT